MDRRKKYQAPVYRTWNALALGLPSKPGEPEPEEPEIKQPTKSSWRSPPGVLVKEVIGQKAPSQIAEWRYSNAVALNKVSDIVPKEKKSYEIYEPNKWNSEQKQWKENWNASSVRGTHQNNWDSSLQQNNWDYRVGTQQNNPIYEPKEGNSNARSKVSFVKPQRENENWNIEPQSNNLQSKHDSSWDPSVSAKKSQNNWNASAQPEHPSSWDSIKPQNDNDNWNSVLAKKSQHNWNASAQPEHPSSRDSIKPQNDNDNWNSVSAKKSQNNWNASMRPEQTGWTLTDEPKEIDYISPVINSNRSNLGTLSQSKHDEEKFNHRIQSVSRKDISPKTNPMDNVPKSDGSRQSREDITKIKTGTEETQIRGNEVKIAISSSIDTNMSKFDSKNLGASDVNKESNVGVTNPISPTKASPQVVRFSEDTKIEPKENPDYLKLLDWLKRLAEESGRNAKDSSTTALTQPPSKPKDEKVQESSAKVNSIEPFQSLIDEEILFYGDAKNQEKHTNTNKTKESAFGWGTESKNEEKWPNFNQPLIESDSSDEESIKSNSSTKEPQANIIQRDCIDIISIIFDHTLSIKPTVITQNQKKPPEIKSPLRATIQIPESKTVAAYIFYNNTFVKENSVLVDLDDDQSALSPPKYQSPPKKESEEVLQELAKLDWKQFLPIPDPNSIKWAKPTDREQKQKKKEVRTQTFSRSFGPDLVLICNVLQIS
ncbi:4023_t:CDS:2 [Ambispora gerdemannii]|uniref:4023_t:CDS:1 n=1 Tax=Ambispora gerdemannii TaxID=144530 RepID=A0A9N9D4T9_9GLOM|nr:4023_t:CDS:2 [Ambispora gerdemannii]